MNGEHESRIRRDGAISMKGNYGSQTHKKYVHCEAHNLVLEANDAAKDLIGIHLLKGPVYNSSKNNSIQERVREMELFH